MEQKFLKFEDAVERLGISADRLNELRDQGQLRAYRDGSSWKFRGDEIERLVTEGIPELPPPSDIGLVSQEELLEAAPIESDEADSDLELQLADADPPAEPASDVVEGESELEDTDPLSQGSELELDDLTEDPSDPSDSILLSEEEMGESVDAPPSTIIGKSELASEDADLELSTDEESADGGDIKHSSGASDVLSSGIAGSGVLDELGESSAGASAFEDLEELEIDLEAESSRILSPDDVAQVQQAAGKPAAPKDDSDLQLDDISLTSDAEGSDATQISAVELVGDDDLVLSDSEGSDITLDSGDSGINLAPADSGLALDDIPLELGGSAILSSLSLGGESDPEISLIGSDPSVEEESLSELQQEDDFQLTPMGEGDQQDDGDSSSQVIALDAELEEFADEAEGILEEDIGEADEALVLTEDYAQQADDTLGTAGYAVPAAVSAGTEAPYSIGNVLLLGSCALLLALGGIMMLDMIRSIWSWNEPYALNSSMLDALLGLLGLK